MHRGCIGLGVLHSKTQHRNGSKSGAKGGLAPRIKIYFSVVEGTMARIFFLTTVLALVVGVAAAANPDLNGEWVSEDAELQLKDGVLEVRFEDTPMMRGTYTVLGDTITMKMTHLNGTILNNFDLSPIVGFDSKWYSQDELRKLMLSALAVVLLAESESLLEEGELSSALNETIAELEEEMDMEIGELFDAMFAPTEATYSLSGNTLTLSVAGEPGEVYIKR